MDAQRSEVRTAVLKLWAHRITKASSLTAVRKASQLAGCCKTVTRKSNQEHSKINLSYLHSPTHANKDFTAHFQIQANFNLRKSYGTAWCFSFFSLLMQVEYNSTCFNHLFFLFNLHSRLQPLLQTFWHLTPTLSHIYPKHCTLKEGYENQHPLQD